MFCCGWGGGFPEALKTLNPKALNCGLFALPVCTTYRERMDLLRELTCRPEPASEGLGLQYAVTGTTIL